ncbi:MAG: hypothetical protein IJ204_01595 [Paludibacteraceae bacterium]|nr:hypothetical protein [Paludibacteraceae bacterium]
MAKADFTGLNNVRGTISKQKVKLPSGEIVTRRMVAQVTPNGHQRVYLREERQRATPVTDKEIAQRNRFAQASAFFYNLSQDEIMMWWDIFNQDHYKFRGKKYATLRGYIIARHMAGFIDC